MPRTILRFASLILAVALLGVSAWLLQPADIYEMLTGFIVGTVGTAQWITLSVAALLLIASAYAARRPLARWQRLASMICAVVIVGIAAAALVRDNRAFTTTGITFASADITFAATLYQPRDAASKSHPAILILHGSGPFRRDLYHMFARRFAERGFIVLNVDKRGVGGTSGKYFGDDLAEPVIEKRAKDARTALEYLVQQPAVDTARVGVFSMSQGGWIVPLLLSDSSQARFAVVFSGVAVSSAEEGQFSNWAGEDNDHFGFKPPPIPLDEIDRRMKTVKPGDFNPRSALARMNRPSVWMFGEWDSSAPTAASLRVIDSLKCDSVPITAHVFPEANHGLFVVRGPHGKRNANFTAGVWDSVFAWTDRQRITQTTPK